MTTTNIKKRPLAGSVTARVWEIADELYRKTGSIPTGQQVNDIYVKEGGNPSTGRTQHSHWKKAYRNHFKRGSAAQIDPASVTSAQLTVSLEGRFVIPAGMRAAMRIGPDSIVTARVVNGELRVIAPAVAIRRARDMVRDAVPDGVSLAGELIAERRAEANKDDDA